MSHRRRTHSLAALAVVASFVVSGCTHDAGPKPQPLPTSTSSSSAVSPSPTPPELPEAAKGRDAAAAKAFAGYYIGLINYGSATGDTEDLEARASSACESCKAIAKNIHQIYDAGGKIESEGWKLQSVAAVPKQPAIRPILDLGVFQSAETVTPSQGAKTARSNGAKQPMTMYLKREPGGWVVDRLDLVS